MLTDALIQHPLKSFPPFTERREARQRETDLHEVIQNVQGFLPRNFYGNIETQMILANQELPVMIDIAQIEVALLHLIWNALEAMPTGGRLTIKTGFAKLHSRFVDGGNDDGLITYAFVSVSDTGCGIDEQTLSKIFEPFYTTKEGAYRGLGLPTAHHTIKQHNGSINVETKLGYGTTVKIYLPLVQRTPVQKEAIPLPPA